MLDQICGNKDLAILYLLWSGLVLLAFAVTTSNLRRRVEEARSRPLQPDVSPGAQHYMVIERFHNNDPSPVYARFAARGRLMPDGLRYITSFVSQDLGTCYQVMECEDRRLLEEWMRNWEDLVDFEALQVVGSEEARRRVMGK